MNEESIAYQVAKKEIDAALKKGYLINLIALRKNVRELSKRINVLCKGAEQDFDITLEKVEKVNLKIAQLSGRRKAYKEFIDMIAKKC